MKYKASEIENVQKRCLTIIFPPLSYNEAEIITAWIMERLDERREVPVHKLFNKIKQLKLQLMNYMNYSDTKQTIHRPVTRDSYP